MAKAKDIRRLESNRLRGIPAPRNRKRGIQSNSNRHCGLKAYDLWGSWRRGISVDSLGSHKSEAEAARNVLEIGEHLPRMQEWLHRRLGFGLGRKVLLWHDRQRAVRQVECAERMLEGDPLGLCVRHIRCRTPGVEDQALYVWIAHDWN